MIFSWAPDCGTPVGRVEEATQEGVSEAVVEGAEVLVRLGGEVGEGVEIEDGALEEAELPEDTGALVDGGVPDEDVAEAELLEGAELAVDEALPVTGALPFTVPPPEPDAETKPQLLPAHEIP